MSVIPVPTSPGPAGEKAAVLGVVNSESIAYGYAKDFRSLGFPG